MYQQEYQAIAGLFPGVLCYILQTQKILQMHIIELESHNLIVCSYMLQRGKGCYASNYPLILMAAFRHHVRFFPVDNQWVNIVKILAWH